MRKDYRRVRVVGTELYFLPVKARIPLKLGRETLTTVICARVKMNVIDTLGNKAEGWGEVPLNASWCWGSWSSSLSMEERIAAMEDLCRQLAEEWPQFIGVGHPLEIGWEFQEKELSGILEDFNSKKRANREPMPRLAALLCNAPFDIALHDAFGNLLQRPIYELYGPDNLRRDLTFFMEPAPDSGVSFKGVFPSNFFISNRREQIRAWHLVGEADLLDSGDISSDTVRDRYPTFLGDWVRNDGLKCLKVKLRGNDSAWDYDRIVQVGRVGIEQGVNWLCADFNGQVAHAEYLSAILDRIRDYHPRIFGMLLHLEQPFSPNLEENPLDVHQVSWRKPLFLDEGAHNWRILRRARQLGWTGLSVKIARSQTSAILAACWACAHGMPLMVSDLSNPMIAQIPHLLLAANFQTLMGVETTAMQFYPEASEPELKVHPGLYSRRYGMVDISSIRGSGFGYRLSEIQRELPPPDKQYGEIN
ncbi:MAG: hypothetical protein M0Q48_09750 [Verrucomicrobia bacterium]|nr:hypothetical protein [Verrucomicrobiota bacterium]